MIINVDRKEFYSSVAALQNVTGKKGTIAILANILIETSTDSIFLTATDLEIGIKINMPAEVLSTGSITLPSKKLFEIIRETADTHLKLEVLENKWSVISTKSGNYRIAGSDSEEYPSFPEFEKDNLSTISCDALIENIDKTIYSVSQEGENQFNLNGALIEKDVDENNKTFIRMVSSDGHRLSVMEREVDTDITKLVFKKTTLIPRKGVLEIRKMSEQNDFIEMGFNSKQAVFRTNNTIMIIRLMNGDFPDYKSIIKAISKEMYISINREEFISSMKRINLFTEDLFNSVQFNFTKDLLTLTSQNMDIGSGKEEIEIDYKGENIALGFNGKYFVESLQVMNSERIKAFINSESSPCLIEGEDDTGFVSVIMPMKI